MFGRYDAMNGPTARTQLGYLDGRYHHVASVEQGEHFVRFLA